jgi:hypothetical protein
MMAVACGFFPSLITAQVMRIAQELKVVMSSTWLDGDALVLVYPRTRITQDSEGEEAKTVCTT